MHCSCECFKLELKTYFLRHLLESVWKQIHDKTTLHYGFKYVFQILQWYQKYVTSTSKQICLYVHNLILQCPNDNTGTLNDDAVLLTRDAAELGAFKLTPAVMRPTRRRRQRILSKRFDSERKVIYYYWHFICFRFIIIT